MEPFVFLSEQNTVFTDAKIIYEPKNGKTRNYYIVGKGRKYAVFRADGKMYSDFSVLLLEAKKLVEMLDGTTKFQPFYNPVKREEK